MVAEHRALHRRLPRRLVLEERQRPVDRRRQLARALLGEEEAPAVGTLLDGIDQATDRVDDGQRAVAQRVELVEAAGLESRGHEERVRAALHAVREAIVELE